MIAASEAPQAEARPRKRSAQRGAAERSLGGAASPRRAPETSAPGPLGIYYGRALVIAALVELDDAVPQREQREVAAEADSASRMNHRADLAHEDLTRTHHLAAIDLGPAPLRVAVAAVARAALPLLVSHDSLDLDRFDAHPREVLPVTLGQAIALAPLVLEDADLRAGRIAFDLGQHLRTGDQRVPDAQRVAADEQHFAELDLLAGLPGEQLDVDDVAGRHTHLLATGSNDCVHGGGESTRIGSSVNTRLSEAPRLGERAFGAGDDVAQHVACGAHGLDHADSLPREARDDVSAPRDRTGQEDRSRDHALERHGQRLEPAFGACLGPLRTDQTRRLPGDRARDDGAFLVAVHDRLLLEILDARLVGREECRADPRARRAEHERRRDAAAVRDGARAEHGNWRDRVDHLRNQRHRAHRRVVPAA